MEVAYSLVFAAGNEGVLVIQHQHPLDAAAVPHEAHQVDEVEVERTVLLTAADLVLPVGEPVLPQVPLALLFAGGLLEGC